MHLSPSAPQASPPTTERCSRCSTAEFARANQVKPQSVRKRYSTTGSYFGITPLRKLPNGRLEWPKPV